MKVCCNLLLCIILLCIGNLNAQNIIVQRTSGVSPVGVHFTINETNWEELKNNDYEWIFPDGDTVIGFQALHTFKASGTVILNVTKPDWSKTTQQIDIVVQDPHDVYSGTNTTCYSTSGDFTGCPAGATTITLSDLATVNFLSNKRLLFKENDTFSLSGSKTLFANSYISSFGSNNDKAVIRISGDATSTTFWMQDTVTITNIAFYGLEWVSSPAWGGQLFGEGQLFAPENHTTLYDLDIQNMTSFAIMDDAIGTKVNLVIDKVNAVNLGSMFVYAGPSPSIAYSGVRNSSIVNVLGHGIRLNGGHHFMAHKIHIDSVERSQITYRGLEYGIVSDSKFTGKGFYKNSIRNISDDASILDTVRYIIYERNQYESRPNEFALDFNIGSDIVVRNNLLINSSFNIGVNLSGVIPQRVEVLNNTFYQNNYDWYSMITLRTGSTGVFKGNIAYADNCVGSCIDENPFSNYSTESSTDWEINQNAYWVNGDTSGLSFKSGMSFNNWQTNDLDTASLYGEMNFVNKTAFLQSANFSPVSGTMIDLTDFLCHRDLLRQWRSNTIKNDAGAIALQVPNTNIRDIPTTDLALEIYPNPTKELINVKINYNKELAYQIINILGQVVGKGVVFTLYPFIDVSNLKSGSYYIIFNPINHPNIVRGFSKID